ncbi:OmpA family protein, partial [Enterobacteriaceae bacterium LUAb1]
LTSTLRELRHQIAQVAHLCQHNINLVLTSYLYCTDAPETWFWQASPALPAEVWLAEKRCLTLGSWLQTATVTAQPQHYCWETERYSLQCWLTEHILRPLTDDEQHDPPVMPVGTLITLTPALRRINGNLWQQWITAHTTLSETVINQTELPLPALPEPLLTRLPTQRTASANQRATLHAIQWLALAGVLALAGSAFNNRHLIRQIADDLHSYNALPVQSPRKAEVVMRLQKVSEQLDHWYRNGEPLRVGLGLYQERPLREAIQHVLADYQPPVAPPAAVHATQTSGALPKMVRLDSLSLFDSGSATLKPGTTKVLVNALVDIKARPGWLILIAGHTDTFGDAHRNQQLSQARALAVRDWMITTSDVPETCFAVQGYGATRPVASNQTAEGRAQNRRVEISLVPDAAACLDNEAAIIASKGDQQIYQPGE